MKKIRQFISKNKLLLFFIKPFYNAFSKKKDFTSKQYWEERYKQGGTSGAGSYGRLAIFKAEIINDFVKNKKIRSVIEFGCGDGNQLSLFRILKYIGLDVSKKSIDLCKERYKKDKTKSFFLYDPQSFIDNSNIFKADLTLSLDVIYHLIEDNVFEKYMTDLFSSSKMFVIIYSCDTDKKEKNRAQHVRLRKFSDWIKNNVPEWKFIQKIDNKYPLKNNQEEESFSDFYIYMKKEIRIN